LAALSPLTRGNRLNTVIGKPISVQTKKSRKEMIKGAK
jgi:hypothetical protein